MKQDYQRKKKATVTVVHPTPPEFRGTLQQTITALLKQSKSLRHE